MSEDVLPHAAFDIVHRKVAVVPIVKPVTPEGEVGLKLLLYLKRATMYRFHVGEFAQRSCGCTDS
jgi:hypothetical protein